MYIYETGNENVGLLEQFAKENRQHPTEAESILWDLLKGERLGIKFRRQHVIGDFIADFVSLKFKVIIEIDGLYHLKGEQIIKDNKRTDELITKGFHVIRFTNDEVIGDTNRVLKDIKSFVKSTEQYNQQFVNPTAPNNQQFMSPSETPNSNYPSPLLSEGARGRLDAWAVDAACSGNPGPMEYQAVDLATGQRVFHFGPMHGTNNIGEFLAIVHALALCWQRGLYTKTIYSDSYNAILWVKKRQCKTKLERTPQTEPLYNIIERAENWLRTHDYRNPIVKWETSKWGEVPADFGRK